MWALPWHCRQSPGLAQKLVRQQMKEQMSSANICLQPTADRLSLEPLPLLFSASNESLQLLRLIVMNHVSNVAAHRDDSATSIRIMNSAANLFRGVTVHFPRNDRIPPGISLMWACFTSRVDGAYLAITHRLCNERHQWSTRDLSGWDHRDRHKLFSVHFGRGTDHSEGFVRKSRIHQSLSWQKRRVVVLSFVLLRCGVDSADWT